MLIALLFWDEVALTTMTTATIIMGMMMVTVIMVKRKMQQYLKIIGRLDPIMLGIMETLGVNQTC